LEVARWLLSEDSTPRPSTSALCFNVDVHVHASLRSWSRARAAWCSWAS
jgi:hypothetical protein